MMIEPENGWVDFLEDGIWINLKNKIVLQNKWIFLELHHIIKKNICLIFYLFNHACQFPLLQARKLSFAYDHTTILGQFSS